MRRPRDARRRSPCSPRPAARRLRELPVPTIEPWVKPYERERLGDPIMKLSRDALPDKHFEHVRVVREGARGATGFQGGGCGCN